MGQTVMKFGKPWSPKAVMKHSDLEPALATPWGVLYQGDCLELLPLVKSEVADAVFADPPFNLGKDYGKRVNDNLAEQHYLEWCRKWLSDCARVLKPGGAIFVYNLPKWNMFLGAYLHELGFMFRHSIAVSVKSTLPIPGRLYPAHYSLLYYTKGKPKTFRRIRTPIELCRHCGREIKDYGGHRDAMNPAGVNLTDVWTDIPPVRHRKFKSKKRKANQLSTKLLYRVIHMSTRRGDIVLDPFGGSGTTYYVSECEGRHWIGFELESCEAIVERFENGDLHPHKTSDYVED